MFRFILSLLVLVSTNLVIANESCKSVTISSHPNYPPFHWRDGASLTGASIVISQTIFESIGVTTDIQYAGPWKRVLKNAELENIEFIPALKNTVERQAYLYFTKESFAHNPVAVFVRRAELFDVSELSDLSHYFGSINAGDRHGDPIDSFVSRQTSMQHIHGLEQNFKMLELGRTDYFITGLYTGQQFIEVNDLQPKVEIKLVFEGLKVHNAFTRLFAAQCPQVVNAFEERLQVLKQQGLVNDAIERYGFKWQQISKL